jgi:hypothetical protein
MVAYRCPSSDGGPDHRWFHGLGRALVDIVRRVSLPNSLRWSTLGGSSDSPAGAVALLRTPSLLSYAVLRVHPR